MKIFDKKVKNFLVCGRTQSIFITKQVKMINNIKKKYTVIFIFSY